MNETVFGDHKVEAVDITQVKKTLQLAYNVLNGLSKVTGTTVDDKVVAFLGQFVNEDWFAELVVQIVNAFDKTKVSNKEDFLKVFVN